MAKGLDWNDLHCANPGAIRDAMAEPDILFDDQAKSNGKREGDDRRFSDNGEPPPNLGDEVKATTALTPLLSYNEMLNLPEPNWLVDGVIPRRAKSVLYGQSNSFKTFHATDLGCSVATGRSYHGKATKKHKVIYVANEGANGVGRKRIPAWMAAHNIPPDERGNIYLVTAETILPKETSRKNLIAAIRTIVEADEEFFLIIDVLRGTMIGSENDDEAAHAWTSAAEILVSEGATLLTVTHSPYSEDGRMRGHSHLWGSFDTRLQSEGDKEKRTSVLKVERHKEHDSRGEWGFQLDEVEVDAHPGEFSLVPRLDGEVKAKAKAKNCRRKLPDSAVNALEALRYAIGEAGIIPPASNHIPPSVKCVTIKQWRDYFDRRTTLDKEDSREKAFSRGSEKLRREEMIALWGSYVWIS
jgi:hypothetical protein